MSYEAQISMQAPRVVTFNTEIPNQFHNTSEFIKKETMLEENEQENPMFQSILRDLGEVREVQPMKLQILREKKVRPILLEMEAIPAYRERVLSENSIWQTMVDRLRQAKPAPLSAQEPSTFTTHYKEFLLEFSLAKPDAAETLIARPLKELVSHVKHLKWISCELFVRVVKVVFMAIFRGHFCDRVMLTSGDGITYGLKDRIAHDDLATFRKKYPYMEENAFRLSLQQTAHEEISATLEPPMRSQTVVDYYHNCCKVDVTSKRINNRVKDLLNSTHFNRTSPAIA